MSTLQVDAAASFVQHPSCADGTPAGRFQRGTMLVASVDTGGIPDDPPILSFVDTAGTTVATHVIPYASPPHTFSGAVLLGPGIALGTFLLKYQWSLGGSPREATGQMEVVGGGDSGGAVIGMYAHERPEARYLIAQLASGILVQGRNPYL